MKDKPYWKWAETMQPEKLEPEDEQTTALYAAMARARSEMKAPTFDATNPHFKSKYLTLAGLLETIMPALSKNGLHIWQAPEGEYLVTMVTHSSGGFLRFESPLPPSTTIQQYGSVLTYMKRYTLSAIVGIAGGDEDDANAAMPMQSNITDEQVANIEALLTEVDANVDAFLKFCRVEKVGDIPAAKYDATIRALEAKRANP